MLVVVLSPPLIIFLLLLSLLSRAEGGRDGGREGVRDGCEWRQVFHLLQTSETKTRTMMMMAVQKAFLTTTTFYSIGDELCGVSRLLLPIGPIHRSYKQSYVAHCVYSRLSY